MPDPTPPARATCPLCFAPVPIDSPHCRRCGTQVPGTYRKDGKIEISFGFSIGEDDPLA